MAAPRPSSLWQDRLEGWTNSHVLVLHREEIANDAGGRTAWSSVVVVCGKRIEARYWYDGNNLNNAREDAAEVALTWLANNSGLSSTW
ncbi:hypothetical protein F5B17DRAFT_431373 [Nemania serpens]|nr:hypothetical protein F5B17DRAFT_431373 [Nemania serpens]